MNGALYALWCETANLMNCYLFDFLVVIWSAPTRVAYTAWNGFVKKEKRNCLFLPNLTMNTNTSYVD